MQPLIGGFDHEFSRSSRGQNTDLILAGGRGERLYPLTADQPKPALPFGGVFRIIDFSLSNALNSGLRRIYVLTQYKQERLHSYVREGWPQLCNEFRWDYGEEIVCLPPSDGKRYRGTADAVFQSLDVIEKSRAEYVLIVSADQVYHMDYGELLYHHATSRADVTMVAVQYPVELAGSLDVIETDPSGRVTGFKENRVSPRLPQSNPEQAHVNIGVYVFGRESLIETLRKNAALNGSDDFSRDILLRSGRAVVFQFGGYWRRIDTLDGYYETNLDLLLTGAAWDPDENSAWPTRTLAGTKCLQRSWLSSQSRVSVGATLTACEVWMSIVSTGVRIDAGAELEAAIVLPGAHIGSGAKIRNAIVAEKAEISPHALIGYDTQGEWPQFPVTDNGVAIVCATEPNRQCVPWQSSHLPVNARSIAVARPRKIQRKIRNL